MYKAIGRNFGKLEKSHNYLISLLEPMSGFEPLTY